ncbi:MAG: hypothetical protein IKY10_03630 [Clostridia bacterium]|nr:hypothetical protein [Clostridia bacterium]
MKSEIKVDNYGFILYNTERERKYKKLYTTMHYGNEKTLEEASITHHYAHHGLLKDLAKHKELVNKYKSMNIVEGYAYIITQRYGVMRDFNGNLDIIDIIKSIPATIVLNDEAVKELLLNLPQQNKHLIVFVGDQIKSLRKFIKEREESEKELNKQVFEDYETLKQEFNL